MLSHLLICVDKWHYTQAKYLDCLLPYELKAILVHRSKIHLSIFIIVAILNDEAACGLLIWLSQLIRVVSDSYRP